MQLLDMRTSIYNYALTNAVGAAVMVLLWRQNRQRLAGLAFCLADFGLLWAGWLLVSLRGQVPDLLSIVVSNTLLVAGTWLLYTGPERFVGQARPGRRPTLSFASRCLQPSTPTSPSGNPAGRRARSTFRLGCWCCASKAPGYCCAGSKLAYFRSPAASATC